jgi:hypothetical protein
MVFALDISLSIKYAPPLSNFTRLKNAVQSSHSVVLCHQSSTLCVDPSLACNGSCFSFSSPSSPSSTSYLLTSLITRSNFWSSLEAHYCQLATGIALLWSVSFPSTLLFVLAHSILKCSLSSVQLLSIGMFGSVLPVTNVKRIKSIQLSKEKLCLYIHESLELHGSPWKLMIANTSGGGE